MFIREALVKLYPYVFIYSYFMEFLNELWQNQQNTVIGIGLGILVLLGIYIKLLDIYK